MKRRMKLNNKNSKFVKSLSVAALAGLTFFGASASAQGVNADDNSSLTFEEGQITGAAAEIAPTLGDNSALSFTQENADANNYNFTDTDENGNIRYWLIKLDNDKISNTDHISWEEVDNLQENTIQVNLPNNKSKFYKYTILDTTGDYIGYTNTSSGNARGGAIYNPSNNKIQANFINNSAIATTYAAQGGAIANYNNSSVKEIAGTFIQNGTSAGLNSNGGAIWINDSIAHDKISGAFIGNYNTTTSTQAGSEGGAIAIHGSFVKNIEGNFIGNYQSAQYRDGGGAGLRYYYGSSDSIKSDFIGNHIEVATQAYGGALAVGYSNIKELTGDFVCNSAVGGYSDGGAIIIYGNSGQNAEIKNIKGSFIGNYAIGNSSYAYGGAIRLKNNGNIESLKGNFLGNYAIGKTEAQGGAISNSSATITAINDAVFIGNYALATGANGYAHGGAIYNTGTIGEIVNSNFENNYAKSEQGFAYGGAIYNSGIISNIAANFIDNEAASKRYISSGGAISNDGTINEIRGDYIRNSSAWTGGAITNGGQIKSITGNFVENYAKAAGSGIYNNGKINTINGVFMNNSAEIEGGGIYNNGIIGKITAAFTNNTADAIGESDNTGGGGIFNVGIITTIESDFDNNSGSQGGGVHNWENGEITTLKGNFTNNSAYNGGGIDNNAVINTIIGGFTNNTAKSSGGGINNSGYIDNISGNFISNSATIFGGGICNFANSTIEKINGSFVGNNVQNSNMAVGGAIANEGKISEINGNFSKNSAYSEIVAAGGAIGSSSFSDTSQITTINITGDFEKNKALGNYVAAGGAIGSADMIENLKANFTNNETISEEGLALGGALVFAIGNLNKLEGNFENNKVTAKQLAAGGAIENLLGGIDYIHGNFINNQAIAMGKLHLRNTLENLGLDIELNEENINQLLQNYLNINVDVGDLVLDLLDIIPNASGGAISNIGNIKNISNSNFINNISKAENGIAHGGAIISFSDLNLSVNNGNIFRISENKTHDSKGTRQEAIYINDISYIINELLNRTGATKEDLMEYLNSMPKEMQPIAQRGVDLLNGYTVKPTLTLTAQKEGKFLIDDQINGTKGYNLKLKGDSTGKVYFNNDVLNANIEHNDVTTFVDGMKYLNHAKGEGINSLTMNSGTLNVGSFNLAPLHFDSFGMNGGTINIDKVDVDLANKTMGRITANSYGGSDKGTINVNAMNVLSDGEKEITPVLFADKSFKNTVKSPVKEAYTKLYRYDVSYDANGKYGEDGYFVFTRGGGSSNPSDGFNPAVLTSPVATQAGAQASMTNTLYYAFEHGDTFMNFSAMDRFAKINSNTYALAERQGALSTDFNSNLNLDYVHQNKAVWTKPYSSFESIHLKNGPKVDVISYGTLIGFDSNIHKLKHGWANVATAYIGYNGSQVDYSNVDASTNGGLLGLTETFYKGNFWTALTATAGAGVAEAHTMYGKDDIIMLMAGIGSKTGYNFEFKEGKFIIQPRLFMSYSFVNTFDYTNSAGVRIDSDPMHTVQINPSVKFIGNIKGGWQPYASVGMVWNLLNETHTEANGVKLPEMHTKPYVEYGVGLQRTWADKFSAYGQAMLRHGGRNGVALTFGFRWALGKDKTQKVQNNSKMSGRQEIKRTSLLRHSGQDDKMLKRVQHDNSNSPTEMKNVGAKKVLKQLSQTQRQKLSNTTTIGNNIYPQKAHLEHTTHTAMNANVEKL